MKNNITTNLIAGFILLSSISMAQNYSEKELSLAYSGYQKKSPTIIYKNTTGVNNVSGTVEAFDYPTVSYPETSNFSVQRENGLFHLTWNVAVSDNLTYTEIQSSSDGMIFTTIGFIVNDSNHKNNGFDYFVSNDKNNTYAFRLVQHSMNSKEYYSEVLSVR